MKPPLTPDETVQLLADLRHTEAAYLELLGYIGSDRLADRLLSLTHDLLRAYRLVEALRAADPVLAQLIYDWETPPAAFPN